MNKLTYRVLFPLFLLTSTISGATEYDCFVEFEHGSTTFYSSCQPPIALDEGEFTPHDAVVIVDMSDWQCLRVAAKIRDPQGWVMNIGNSYSNNGGAGDIGDFSNDSEFDITFDETLVPESKGQGLLRVFDNDYTVQAIPILKIGEFIDEHRSGIRIEIGDQCLRVRTCGKSLHRGAAVEPQGFLGPSDKAHRFTIVNRNATLQSEYIFRLGGADAEAGKNDFRYWVGLNRVVQSDSNRSGKGVQKVFFTLSTDACESCN